jgi:hypothetical protein
LSLAKALRKYISLPNAFNQSAQLVPGGGGDVVPIPQAHNIKAMGSLPRISDGDRTKAEAFLTEFLRYLMLNQGVARFESLI